MHLDDDNPLTPAERQDRWRRRKRDGAIPIPAGSLEVSAELSEVLIDADLLDAMDAENPVAIAEALARLHEWWRVWWPEHGTDKKHVTS